MKLHLLLLQRRARRFFRLTPSFASLDPQPQLLGGQGENGDEADPCLRGEQTRRDPADIMPGLRVSHKLCIDRHQVRLSQKGNLVDQIHDGGIQGGTKLPNVYHNEDHHVPVNQHLGSLVVQKKQNNQANTPRHHDKLVSSLNLAFSAEALG